MGEIGSGGMGTIYRAEDLMSEQLVALKRVAMASENLIFSTKSSYSNIRMALAQEFRLLSSLRHPHIISVLDYGFDENRVPYYTMDLLKNAQTVVNYALDRPRKEQIRVLIQIAQALAYLHRRGIIHRDLKPENVLVENDTVRVLDFGLAIHSDALRDQENSDLSGTLSHMAPEVLMGAPPTEQSDLYALGLIAYELLYGYYPFDTQDTGSLLQDIFHRRPEFDIRIANVGGQIRDVLERLLEKDPEERFESANDLIPLFLQETDEPMAAESAVIRDSYIQAAEFVGREHEQALLETALAKIIPTSSQSPEGSAWLIGGESGVGKSRLIEEIRTIALVRGALVLRGQSRDSGELFQTWQAVVRRLILSTELDDFTLGVLKELVPDVEALTGRSIPSVPEVGKRAGVERLAEAVRTLFTAQTRPIVLLLEDLHWAYESLDILPNILEVTDRLPLMIIGTYRNEEMPSLPQKLPQMHNLVLERLSEQEIRDLSTAMLGEEVGQQSNVINLLKRETEGNLFFLVEVVRVLAEEAGNLRNIGVITLPDSVFSGSMRTVIERRLSRLPLDAQPMLRLAAVYGREIDLKVLRQINPYMDLETWLLKCSNAAILEALGDTWRFAHDRMRDGILDVLDAAQRPKLNEMVAEAIEEAYPDNERYAIRLMRHWSAAGYPDKEAYHARVAARQAFSVSDYREALALYSRAASITGADTPASAFVDQGDIHYRLGNFRAAQASLGMALRRKPSVNERARALSIMGSIASDQGAYREAQQILTKAFETIEGKEASASTRATVLASLGEVHWRLGNITKASNYLYRANDFASEVNNLDQGLFVLDRIATIALYDGKMDDAEAVLEDAYHSAVAANHSERAMMLIDSLGVLAREQRKLFLAETRFTQAIEIAYRLRLNQQVPALLTNRALVQIASNKLVDAERDLHDALSQATSSGRSASLLRVIAGLAVLAYHQGKIDEAVLLSGLVLVNPAVDYPLRQDVLKHLARWDIPIAAAKDAAADRSFERVVQRLSEA